MRFWKSRLLAQSRPTERLPSFLWRLSAYGQGEISVNNPFQHEQLQKLSFEKFRSNAVIGSV